VPASFRVLPNTVSFKIRVPYAPQRLDFLKHIRRSSERITRISPHNGSQARQNVVYPLWRTRLEEGLSGRVANARDCQNLFEGSWKPARQSSLGEKATSYPQLERQRFQAHFEEGRLCLIPDQLWPNLDHSESIFAIEKAERPLDRLGKARLIEIR
jgi:hypothetical protein